MKCAQVRVSVYNACVCVCVCFCVCVCAHVCVPRRVRACVYVDNTRAWGCTHDVTALVDYAAYARDKIQIIDRRTRNLHANSRSARKRFRAGITFNNYCTLYPNSILNAYSARA